MTEITKKLTTVTVGDTEYTLVPTLAAVRSITNVCGGLLNVGSKIINRDYDAIAAIIVAGANLTMKPKQYDAFVEAIWKSEDFGSIADSCVEYWRVLNAGGRDPDEIVEEDEESEKNV